MMIVVMHRDASVSDISTVLHIIEESDCTAHVSKAEEKTVVGVVGDDRGIVSEKIQTLQGVEKIFAT
ncbi:MAG TPA: chorismate mutase, partial [bacterium]|nr:chorismate mutase [bacterium]